MKYSENLDDKFFLSLNGKEVGPFPIDSILQKLESREHQWTDYVFDPVANEWILLLEHPLFAPHFSNKVKKPQPPKSKPETSDSELKEKSWFILKESQNIGPFSKIELIQMLQSKALFEYDYVWHKDLPAWKRVSETEELAPEKIKELKAHTDLKNIFFRRKHVRTDYGCHITLHNNVKIFKGKSIEVSEGGAGVILNTAQFNPGDILYLHFQPGEGVPPFNAVCCIMSKRALDDQQDQVQYGMKFVHLGQKAQVAIRQFAKKGKSHKEPKHEKDTRKKAA